MMLLSSQPSSSLEENDDKHARSPEEEVDDDDDDMRINAGGILPLTRQPFRWRAKPKPTKLWLMCRFALILFAVFVAVSVSEALLFPSYQNPPRHYQQLAKRIHTFREPCRGNPHDEKVFIAANIVDEGMIRGAWGESLRELVEILGAHNVHVSIYEDGGGEGTQDALGELQAKLSCESSIVTGDRLPLSDLPTVTMPNGEQRTKRIAYLAELRNRALWPLGGSYAPPPGSSCSEPPHIDVQFDRILFLDDIYFSPTEAANLLFSTNMDDAKGKASYRAACAMDFVSNIAFHDTFAARDAEGYSSGTMLYPWFAPVGSSRTRNDVLAGKDAVRVRSCWGGMVAMRGDAIQRYSPASSTANSSSELLAQFRHEPEPYWEASEGCLLLADLEGAEKYDNSFSDADTGVFVNPYVRVAYSPHTWRWLAFSKRVERAFKNVQWIVSKIAYREHNPRRNYVPGQVVLQEAWKNAVAEDGQMHGGSFEMVGAQAPPGGFCGQRRMFAMREDVKEANMKGEKNWEEMPVPRR